LQTEWLKFAAACSLTQQPCDRARSFNIIRSFIANKEGRELVFEQRPSWMWKVQPILDRMKASSQRTFNDFFLRLPALIEKAFAPGIIQEGWRKSGMYPYNPVTILKHWPLYEFLDQSQVEEILRLLPEGAEKASHKKNIRSRVPPIAGSI